MHFTQEFLDGAKALDRNWSMGVELASPLLYALVRSTRPRTVLEVGAGYSSLFILQALADNCRENELNRQLLHGHGRADGYVGLKRLVKGRHPLPLALPEYYASAIAPRLIVIDNMSNASTSANLVRKTAQSLGFDELLRFCDGDFRGMSASLELDAVPFDFVWFDCGSFPEYRDFLDEYWPLVRAPGGLLLLHSTLTNHALRPIVESLATRSSREGFEMLNLLEPHKYRQNSITILRKADPLLAPLYTDVP